MGSQLRLCTNTIHRPSGDTLGNILLTQEPPSNYYVANFKDYRFLEVFYPTRGILTWYPSNLCSWCSSKAPKTHLIVF
jgi:hypothetical protein